jgi:monoamine oxidase
MFDVVIIGAGAAGLEAARVLRKSGLQFCVLEARSEVGGRVRMEGLHSEFELGAEFIHGEAELTKRRLAEFGLSFQVLDPDFHLFKDERLHAAPRYWETLAHAFSHLRRSRGDRPFTDFIACSRLTPSERVLSASFVEGFQAAELDRIGTNSLVGLSRIIADPARRAIARPVHGYTPLFRSLADASAEMIRLCTLVTEIEWKRGSVLISAEAPEGTKTFHARAVLVTLPIGVLKNASGVPGGVRFTPEIPGLARSLARLEMGQVVRLTLEFAPETRSVLYAKFSRGFPFISSPELDYETWWGNEIAGRPTVTAWAGGARAIRLSPKLRPERVEIAIANLARILGLRRSTLSRGLRQFHHHDWAQDPFARGAYSYSGLGAKGAAERLLRSTERTVYFAGEALDLENSGTVEGAFASGRKQARKIVAALGARPVSAPILHAPFGSSLLR